MNFYVNECFLSVDPGESPYKCTQCSRAFVRSTDLQRHLRNHTGEKPYKCQECSRAFARSTDLKRHMRTHTGEKPYKCWQCSKAFSQSGSLQTHLHTHYKESLQMKGVLPDKTKRTWIVKKKVWGSTAETRNSSFNSKSETSREFPNQSKHSSGLSNWREKSIILFENQRKIGFSLGTSLDCYPRQNKHQSHSCFSSESE